MFVIVAVRKPQFRSRRQSNTKGFKPPKKIAAASGASVVEPAAEQKPKRVSDLAIPTPAGILRKYPSQVPGGITSGMHHRARAGECMDQIVFPLNSENLSLQLGSTLGSNAIEKLFQSFNIELSNKSLCPTNLPRCYFFTKRRVNSGSCNIPTISYFDCFQFSRTLYEFKT